MIVEVAAIVAALAGGALLMRTLGLRGWGLAPLGFLAGLFLELVVGTLQLTFRVATNPIITLAVAFLVPLVWWIVQWRRGRDVGFDWRASAAVFAAVLAVVAAFRTFNIFRWHVDSLVYLNVGELLANGNYYDAVNNYLLTKRLIGVPYMHAPAALIDETYLRSIVPLMSIAILGTFAWFLQRGLARTVSSKQIVVFAALGLLFLVSANRFVFHALYLNGHLLVGGGMLIVVATSWLLARGMVDDARFLLPLAAMAMLACVVTRPEGAVFCFIALVPAMLSPAISLTHRRVLAGSLAAASFLWFGTCVTLILQFGNKPAPTLIQMLAVSLVIAAATWAVGLKWLTSRDVLLVRLAEAGLWLLVIVLTVRAPRIIVESVIATGQNTVYGKWGLTLIMTAMLVIGAVVALRAQASTILRFAVTTFFPVALVLADVRGGPYRDGHYDSLNRMWLQVLPLAVFYVTVMLAEGRWAPRLPAGWNADADAGASSQAKPATATRRAGSRRAAGR